MWRFKRSFVNPKTGDIRLYYIRPDDSTAVLTTNKGKTKPVWPDVPADVEKDAQNRVKVIDLR